MLGQAANPRSEESAPRGESLEPANESRSYQDQLEVRPQSSPPQIRLQKQTFHTVKDLGAISTVHKARVAVWRARLGAESRSRRSGRDREEVEGKAGFIRGLRARPLTAFDHMTPRGHSGRVHDAPTCRPRGAVRC